MAGGFNPSMMQGVRQQGLNNMPPGTPVSKLSKGVRIGFIRKVYTILFCQLTITALFVTVGAVSESYQNFVRENLIVFVLAIIGYIASLITLFCCRGVARTVPLNYILLGLLTLCMSYTT